MTVTLLLASSFILGIGVGMYFPIPAMAAVVFQLFAIGALIWLVCTRRPAGLITLIAVFFLGASRPTPEPNRLRLAQRAPCRRTIEGTLEREPSQVLGEQQFIVQIQSSSDCDPSPVTTLMTPASGLLFLTAKGEPHRYLHAGDRIAFTARARPVVARRNRAGPQSTGDSETLSATVAAARSIVLVDKSSRNVGTIFVGVKRILTSFWTKTIGSERAAWVQALTCGDTSQLLAEDKSWFRATGTSHILSVSGLHLGIVTLLVFAILRLLLGLVRPLARRIDIGIPAALCAIPIVAFLALFMGAGVPVLRAAVMVICGLLGAILGKERGSFEALFLAAVALLLLDPSALSTPGFQLSFTAVFGLFIAAREPAFDGTEDPLEKLNPPSRRRIAVGRVRRFLGEVTRSVLAATAITTPLVLYHFGYVSLLAIPANLVVIPVTSFFLLAALFVTSVTALFAPTVAAVFAVPIGYLLGALAALLHWLANLPFATWENPGLAAMPIICALAIATFCFLHRKPIPALTFALAALAAAILGWGVRGPIFTADQLTVDFLDVGQGDATLVTFPNGKHWLIDAGPAWENGTDAGAQIVAPFLRDVGVEQLDVAIVTHPDLDHVGGMASILRAVPTTEIWDTDQGRVEGADPSYGCFLAQAKERGIPLRTPKQLCGERWVSSVLVSVVGPCIKGGSFDPARSANDNSIVLALRLGNVTIVLPGDIEKGTEETLVRTGKLPGATILKLPHHGSAGSSTPIFLDHLAPLIAIASAGPFNRFHFPHPLVQERLRQREIPLYRTDLQGGIRIVTDGISVEIETVVSGNTH